MNLTTRNKTSSSSINTKIPSPTGGVDWYSRNLEIRNALLNYSPEGDVRYESDSDCETPLIYNVFNSYGANAVQAFVCKFLYDFIEKVNENLIIIDDLSDHRKMLPNITNVVRSWLKNPANVLPDTIDLIRDYVLYGVCGYMDIDDEIKKISIINGDRWYYKTPDEWFRFYDYPRYGYRPLIELHTPNTLRNDLPVGTKYIKIINSEIVKLYDYKPYRLHYFHIDEISGEPVSIGQMILSVIKRSSLMNSAAIIKAVLDLIPPIGIDVNSNPRSQSDWNSNNASVDLNPGGVTYFEARPQVEQFINLKNVATANSSLSEYMNIQNVNDGITASSLHGQANIGATKSNITAEAQGFAQQQQDLTMEMLRRKFIREFYADILFARLSRDKRLGIVRPTQLYFGGLDGDLNSEDLNKQKIYQELQMMLGIVGEEMGRQLISIPKILNILRENSVYDIYN